VPTESKDLPGDEAIPAEWLREFEAAARRPLEQRLRYAFIHTYKPVLDDARFRAFDTMSDYRKWCEDNLPPGSAMAAFEYRQAHEVHEAFRILSPLLDSHGSACGFCFRTNGLAETVPL